MRARSFESAHCGRRRERRPVQGTNWLNERRQQRTGKRSEPAAAAEVAAVLALQSGTGNGADKAALSGKPSSSGWGWPSARFVGSLPPRNSDVASSSARVRPTLHKSTTTCLVWASLGTIYLSIYLSFLSPVLQLSRSGSRSFVRRPLARSFARSSVARAASSSRRARRTHTQTADRHTDTQTDARTQTQFARTAAATNRNKKTQRSREKQKWFGRLRRCGKQLVAAQQENRRRRREGEKLPEERCSSAFVTGAQYSSASQESTSQV